MAPGAANAAVLHSAQLKDDNNSRINLARQTPLPPIEPKYQQQISRNDSETPLHQFNVGRNPHGRLAPLFNNNNNNNDILRDQAMNNNAYTLHGGQQNFSLRGVPVIPVPQDKRRPLPTPPSLE